MSQVTASGSSASERGARRGGQAGREATKRRGRGDGRRGILGCFCFTVARGVAFSPPGPIRGRQVGGKGVA